MADDEIFREIARLLAKSKSRSEMAGEVLREIAVLLLVFAPLEWLFNPGVLRVGDRCAVVAGSSSWILGRPHRGGTRMIITLLPAAIFGLIVGILGLRWAKQERDENQARRRRLKY